MLLFDTLLAGLLALCCNLMTWDRVPICWLAALLYCPRLETSPELYKQANYTPGLFVRHTGLC